MNQPTINSFEIELIQFQLFGKYADDENACLTLVRSANHLLKCYAPNGAVFFVHDDCLEHLSDFQDLPNLLAFVLQFLFFDETLHAKHDDWLESEISKSDTAS